MKAQFNRTLQQSCKQAFTLVELMVSVAILVVLMLVVSNFIGLVQRTWVRTNTNVSQFREARLAFDIMTRTISQATLNTYWQTERSQISQSLGQSVYTSSGFTRHSELQFVCGPTAGGSAGALFSGGAATSYPGHGIFFQAPLGITSLLATNEDGDSANTQNMVNLLCGRGYFVSWGDDADFRPLFLASKGVPNRWRLRLMEFSPTAEKNRIYDKELRPITAHSKEWFTNAGQSAGAGTSSALTQTARSTENEGNRAFTRPVAENILALVISPQMPTIGQGGGVQPYRIAPNYSFDSVLVSSPGAGSVIGEFGAQGTQHVLPPVLKVTMVAVDARSGERLSYDNNLLTSLVSTVNGLFQTVNNYDKDVRSLEAELIKNRIAYRVFSTSIPLKQARWSR
jgi:uncharacterized protein (TIGR02599 family)